MAEKGIERYTPRGITNNIVIGGGPGMSHDPAGSWVTFVDYKAHLTQLQEGIREGVEWADKMQVEAESRMWTDESDPAMYGVHREAAYAFKATADRLRPLLNKAGH